MKKKLSLKGLKVKSFVTTFEEGREDGLKGGVNNANARKYHVVILTDPKGTNYNTCLEARGEYKKAASEACEAY